jgi:Domain of unknown function (DUF4252)
MNLWKLTLVASVLLSRPVLAQQIKLPPSFEKLSAVAKESVQVTLDESMLKFASGFMSNNDGNEAAAKKLIEGLKGVYVRTFEFDRDGAYPPEAVDAIREQLTDPQWVRIVTVRENEDKEEVGVWMHRENETTTGMVVLVIAPREITFVNLVGIIRPEDLKTLGGQFGIPKIENPEKKE